MQRERAGLAAWLFAMLLTWMLPAAAGELDDKVKVNLIDAGIYQGRRLAGVVVRLAPGWKTYWRVPGEGGVPPRFDFAGSTNLKEAKVLWPAPKRFSSAASGESIGYKHLVVFPLLITPREAGAPVRLHLKLDYGVCGEMCIPVHAERTLELPVNASPDPEARALVRQWLNRTPLMDDGKVRIAAARLRTEGRDLALEVAIAGPAAAEISDVLVEGVPLAVFGKARKVEEAPERVTFRIPVRGYAKAGDFAGARLRFTILRNERAVVRAASLP